MKNYNINLYRKCLKKILQVVYREGWELGYKKSGLAGIAMYACVYKGIEREKWIIGYKAGKKYAIRRPLCKNLLKII